ncbi:unnamed protein product [Phytophthora lilii]|uniref:Unnamed protein product n=1 Tax=Phytophthora lilii TaxID=2077276 RepID=A0A9W6TAT5_9STRA|nr:unnamed protein product [Phytophthora lilii]
MWLVDAGSGVTTLDSDRESDLRLGTRIWDGEPMEGVDQLTPGPDHYGLTLESLVVGSGDDDLRSVELVDGVHQQIAVKLVPLKMTSSRTRKRCQRLVAGRTEVVDDDGVKVVVGISRHNFFTDGQLWSCDGGIDSKRNTNSAVFIVLVQEPSDDPTSAVDHNQDATKEHRQGCYSCRACNAPQCYTPRRTTTIGP